MKIELKEDLRLRIDNTKAGTGEGLGEKQSLAIVVQLARTKIRDLPGLRADQKRRSNDKVLNEIVAEMEELESLIREAQEVIDDDEIPGVNLGYC